MMRLAELKAHIDRMGELRDVVGAMRSLAGMRVIEAHNALPRIRQYAESAALAIGTALLLLPETPSPATGVIGRRALVLFTAEHGFVGGFNERLLETTQPLGQRDTLFVLGTRGAVLAREHGLRPLWTKAMPTRLTGVPETVRALSSELYRHIAHGDVSRVEMIHARHRQAGIPRVERRPLLPLDLRAFASRSARRAPVHNLASQPLLEKVVAEYVFAVLMEATAESIASENAARLSAMESAHDNVSKRLDELRRSAQQARQAEITTELLDLMIGAEAVQR